jgi:site-specific recombinase XerD
MKDLFELKREFLEYSELDKGQSGLTISGYDRYLARFFVFLQNQKKEIRNPIRQPADETRNKSENLNDQMANDKINDQCEMKNEKLFPSDITQETIRQYRLHVNRLKDKKGQDLKSSTQNYHILAVRAFLRYLAFRGIESLSPEKVSIAKTGDREITFLESDELKSILESPDTTELFGLRDRAIMETLFSTGMRVSELAALNTNQLNFDRGEIAVLGKGRKLRVVFLSEEAIKWLDQYLMNRGANPGGENEGVPVFISQKNTRLSVRSIERILEKYSRKAGMIKKVSPHTLRHSFATDLLISGADVRSVQSLLGHSSITTTQVYTHVTDQHLREIHQSFHGRTMKRDDK